MRSCTAATLLGPTKIQMPHGVDSGEPRVIVHKGKTTLCRPVGRVMARPRASSNRMSPASVPEPWKSPLTKPLSLNPNPIYITFPSTLLWLEAHWCFWTLVATVLIIATVFFLKHHKIFVSRPNILLFPLSYLFCLLSLHLKWNDGLC